MAGVRARISGQANHKQRRAGLIKTSSGIHDISCKIKMPKKVRPKCPVTPWWLVAVHVIKLSPSPSRSFLNDISGNVCNSYKD